MTQSHRTERWQRPVTLRLAQAADAVELERLAKVDSSEVPAEPVLVAERDGRIEAALSLSTHAFIADPFKRTLELGELLRCHAGQFAIEPPERPSFRLRPRPSAAPA
jgi:hypothetical protein